MSTEPPELTEPRDPALRSLVRALTADGTAEETAGRQAALEMFRASRRRPRRHRWAVSVSAAAAALVLAGGTAGAYAAALPAPVQHIAYRMLGSIGVPDTKQPAPSPGAPAPNAPKSGVPGLAASTPPRPSAHATTACPCPGGGPAAGTAGNLVLTAARARILAGGKVVLAGQLTSGGRPEAGVRIRLFERAGAGPGWRKTGTAVTGSGGAVTLTVRHLTSNASFRLAVPGGAVSPPVAITVIAPVHLALAAAGRAGLDLLTARAPFAQAGDVVVLQELSGGVWQRVGERVLGRGHRAFFTVLVPRSGQAEYRVVLPATAVHGPSVSGWVRVAELRAAR